MRRIILVLMLEMIFSGFIQAEEISQSTKTVKAPKLKLLWKKEFDGEVKCFAAFHDGSYIAVGVDKSEYGKKIYKNEIILLNEVGEKLWTKELRGNWTVRAFGNKNPVIIVDTYGEVRIYDWKGNIIWQKHDIGVPIISPNDKYIVTVHNGLEGVTPRGIKLYDMEGDMLWKYNPHEDKLILFEAIFMSDELISIVGIPYAGKEYKGNIGKMVPMGYPGKVVVMRVPTGEKLYETTYECNKKVSQILDLNYDLPKNELKLILSSYPQNEEIIVPLPSKIREGNFDNNQCKEDSGGKLNIKISSSAELLRGRDIIESDLFIVKKIAIKFRDREFNTIKEFKKFKETSSDVLRHPALMKSTLGFYRK